MKNQYFADQRDFLKYDLLVELVENSPGVRRLTNIPMLTPNDDTGEGNVLAFTQENQREDIYHFLRYCLARGSRNIRNLRTLFQGRNFEYHSDHDELHYSYNSRQTYFSNVSDSSLQDAVVFIDPDTGIQVDNIPYMQRAGIDRYLFWSDIQQIFERMNDFSILVLYQHLQRNANLVAGNLQDKSTRLRELINVPVVSILHDGDVAYLITSKSQVTMNHLTQSLLEYAQSHELTLLPANPQ